MASNGGEASKISTRDAVSKSLDLSTLRQLVAGKTLPCATTPLYSGCHTVHAQT